MKNKGFTTFEIIMALFLIGIVLLPLTIFFNTLSQQKHTFSINNKVVQHVETYFEEMRLMPFAPLDKPSSVQVIPPNRNIKNKRSLFTSLDDYHDWVEAPPQEHDGKSISALSNYKIAVSVNVTDLPTGHIKEITIKAFNVKNKNEPPYTLSKKFYKGLDE
ncbi:hypothetical protein ACFL56_01525 [Candidatus Margulisiibacteriota bacterium]